MAEYFLRFIFRLMCRVNPVDGTLIYKLLFRRVQTEPCELFESRWFIWPFFWLRIEIQNWLAQRCYDRYERIHRNCTPSHHNCQKQ